MTTVFAADLVELDDAVSEHAVEVTGGPPAVTSKLFSLVLDSAIAQV